MLQYFKGKIAHCAEFCGRTRISLSILFFTQDIKLFVCASQGASIQFGVFQKGHFFEAGMAAITSRFLQNSARFPFGLHYSVSGFIVGRRGCRGGSRGRRQHWMMNFARLLFVNDGHIAVIGGLQRLPLHVVQTLLRMRFGPNVASLASVDGSHVVHEVVFVRDDVFLRRKNLLTL